MKRFGLGLVIGLLAGAASVGVAAELQGGRLYGWEVTRHGAMICSEPWSRPALRAIECE